MKKARLAKNIILFFVISDFIVFLVLFIFIYNFMGVDFSIIIKESVSPVIISLITYAIVSYIIYVLLKPITLIEEGVNEIDNEIILKTTNRVGFFLIIINLIGFIVAPAIAVIVRIIIDGFLRWSTFRLFIICTITGIIMGIFQYLYLIYKTRKLKLQFNIIEFEFKKSKIGLKNKVFFITFLFALFIGINFYLFTLTTEESIVGISRFAILTTESKESPSGYFTKLLELAKKSNDPEVKKEAQYLIENWENFNKKPLLKLTLFFILIMTIFSVFLYILVNSIVSVVDSINNRVKKISNIEGDLTQFIVKTNDDELGELQISINKLIISINRFLYTIHDTIEEISSKTNLEKDNVNNLINFNENFFKLSSNIQKDIDNHIKQVNNTTELIRNLISLNEVNFKIIQNQSTMIEESSASIEEMGQSIKSVSLSTSKANELGRNLNIASKDGYVALVEMKEIIDRITQFGSTIMEIVDTISNIAEQTDLLAMNAAIEAAHAGEYGKGFAVVADEIRKLAENSNNQTKEISKILKSMTDIINNAQEKSENMSLAMQKIQVDIENTIRIIEEIDNATKEQLLNSQDNMKAIQELVSITNNIIDNLRTQESKNKILIENIEIMEKFSKNVDDVSKKQISYFNDLNKNFNIFKEYFDYVNKTMDILNVKFNRIKLADRNLIKL